MTMHMVHPGLTTINTGKAKKKASVKQQRAAAEHNAWLRSQGLHPDQLAAKPKSAPSKLNKVVEVDRAGPQVSNGFAPGGAKKSVFDSQWKRTYEDDPVMAAREEEALKKAEAIKANLMPLYNKGPVQLQTNLGNLKDGNGRGRN
jgi:hypothetical protein